MSKTGKLSLRNSSSQLEYAYSSSEWAYIYSKRCLFSENEHYVPTLLDITVSPADHQEIDADVADIKATLKNQATTQNGPLANVKADFEALGKTKQAQEWEAFENQAKNAPAAKAFHAHLDKVVLDTKGSFEGRPNGVHLDNAKIPGLKQEWAGLKQHAENMKNSPLVNTWKQHAKATFETPEGKKFIADAKAYSNSAEGATLKQKVEHLKADMKKDIKVTDKPQGMQ